MPVSVTNIMRLREITPNPSGGIERLFLLDGNCIDGPVSQIDGAEILGTGSAQGALRIFHFNDLHNHLHDLTGEHKGTHRFSQMVKRVKDARAFSDTPTLFLSIGDDHTGTMLDELIGWQNQDFILDASYRAYSFGGVDATVLGNHEFDRGSELLSKAIRQDTNFPILSANIHSSKHLVEGSDYSPAAIAICGGLRIGLLGLTTHIETRVGQESDPTLAVASPIKTVENILPALAELVDAVLILSHCGFGDGAHKSGKAAAVRDIGEADFSIARTASKCTDKPLLILGSHTHTRLNENGFEKENLFHGVPIFQAESNGRFLGEIELKLDPKLPNRYAIEKACLHPIKPIHKTNKADHTHFEQPEDYDQDFEAKTIAPIVAQVEGILNSKIATIKTDALSYEKNTFSRYGSESALANFVCDAICERLEDQGIAADFAFINGASFQAGIEQGELTSGEWFNVMPYADEVFLVQASGLELQQILESNAKRILRKEEIATTDYTGFLARGFFHTSKKLRYHINTGHSASEAHVTNIEFNGQPIADLKNQKFNIIMSTYLALGGFGEHWNGKTIGGGVPGNLQGYDLRKLPSQNLHMAFRDEVANHLRTRGTIDSQKNGFCDGRVKISRH